MDPEYTKNSHRGGSGSEATTMVLRFAYDGFNGCVVGLFVFNWDLFAVGMGFSVGWVFLWGRLVVGLACRMGVFFVG